MRKHYARARINVITLLVAALGLALAGCKQDPLADYPATVQNATPGQETPKEDPIIRDSLFIDSNEFYHVKEGEELTFEIKGRVLLKNTTFEIDVDNLSDFKGAKYDAATGVFTWKVPQDIVKNEMQEILPLKVVLLADNKGSVLFRDKVINIFVLRDLASPIIMQVNGLNTVQVREGSVQNFEVIVKSPEEISKPIMSVVMNHVGTENGSGFVSLRRDIDNPMQNAADKSLWTFYLQLNLSDADVTNSVSNLYFGLQAYSSFGMMSPVKDASAKVITSWADPKNSWTQEIQFTQGRENTYTFTLMDPREEGRIEGRFNNCQQFGANCSCATGVSKSTITCTVSWNPQVGHVTRLAHAIKFTAFNRSTVTTDPNFTQKEFTGSIRVVAAPAPPPTPSPTPVPAEEEVEATENTGGN